MKKYFTEANEKSLWENLIEKDPKYAEKIKKLYGIPSKKIEGIDLRCEMWYNAKGVVAFMIAVIDSHLMEGDIGPEVGFMTSLLWVGDEHSRLYSDGIGRLVPALKKLGFVGQIGMNIRVNKDSLSAQLIEAKVNISTLYVIMEMYGGNSVTLLRDFNNGTLEHIGFISRFGVGVHLCVPPFPYDLPEPITVEVKGLNKNNLKHFWTNGIYKDGRKYYYRGKNGDIGVVTSRGDAIGNWCPMRDARRRALRTISNIKAKGLMYRRDVGERGKKVYDQLNIWGWL